MSVFKKDAKWGEGELYYEFADSGHDEVEKIIQEINDLYAEGHTNKPPLMQPKGSETPPRLLKIHNTSGSEKGAAGTVGRPDADDAIDFKCQFGKPTNIRHELLHVLGFEHETFHKSYFGLLKLVCAPKFLLGNDKDEKRQDILRSMKLEDINKEFPELTYKFLGQRTRRGSMGDVRSLRQTLNQAPTGTVTTTEPPTLDAKNSPSQAMQSAHDDAKKKQPPGIEHSLSPDAATVMMYSDLHNSLAKLILNFNAYLPRISPPAASLITASQAINLKLTPLSSASKLDEFTASEKTTIKGY